MSNANKKGGEKMSEEKRILPEKNWSNCVEFPCGCSATMEQRGDTKQWCIDNFCEDHDPSLCPNDTNIFEEEE